MLSILSVINLTKSMPIIDTLNRMFVSRLPHLKGYLDTWRHYSRRVQIAVVASAFCMLSGLTGAIALPCTSLAATTSPLPAAEEIAPLPDGADIAADKVDQFVLAYLQVLKLLSDREPELPAAETSAEAVKVQQAIEADAIQLIEESGLTMPEYMQMLKLASKDAAFRDKVLSRMDASIEAS